MKDSGIQWIGEIPHDWKIRKGKTIYKVTTGKLDVNAEMPEGDYPFFTCSVQPKRIDKYAFDCEALLVAGNGIVGYTQYYNGKFNAYQRTYVLHQFIDVDPALLKHYVSICLPIEVAPNAVGSVIQFIKLGDLLNFNIALPEIKQQQKIANFLDRKCAQLDALIAHEEATIDELKAYKQAVITETVTKGLDKSVPMKDSKIEWMGEIPNNWEQKRLKSLFVDRCGGSWGDEARNDANDVVCVRVADFDFEKQLIKNGDKTIRNYEPQVVERLKLEERDLLLEKSGGGEKTPVGRTILAKGCQGFLFANFIDRLRIREMYHPRFVAYLFRSLYCNGVTFPYIKQTTGIQNLDVENFLSEIVFVPEIEYQQLIADYLDRKCADIDSIVFVKQQKIEELKEYKKSLIYEYVTGKKEVAWWLKD